MERTISFTIALLTVGLSASVTKESLVGEWALAPSGQAVSAVMEFKEDGTVINKTAEGYGSYQILADGRLMIEFPDGIIMGEAREIDGKIMVNGSFSASQPFAFALSEVNEDKVLEAQQTQKQVRTALADYESAMERVRKTSQQKMIINNLRQIASASQQYMLETGNSKATWDDIVGKDKYISRIEAVNGESYEDIVVTIDTTTISVTDGDGESHSYNF